MSFYVTTIVKIASAIIANRSSLSTCNTTSNWHCATTHRQ
jgi:hypothetical protein